MAITKLTVNYVMQCRSCKVCYLCENIEEKLDLESKVCKVCGNYTVTLWSQVNASDLVK